MLLPDSLKSYFQHFKLPELASHKGQNGKLLLIGGSELFHAASKWSLDVASQFVDMVFYASVPSNNELIRAVKGEFWNGIVIGRDQIENYVTEADVILIGPGMERNSETETVTNSLLQKYPHKKWVLDAGALQMVDVNLLNENCLITPHHAEFERVWKAVFSESEIDESGLELSQLKDLSTRLQHVCILSKGLRDVVIQGDRLELIEGGNAGMTKGGTGDVLAGLVAALYCSQPVFSAAVIGSYINKKAGENLAQKMGPFFNASQLVLEIPRTLWTEISALD